jgi:hypothetical protein
MTYTFTARAVAAEVDPDSDVMQAGVAEDEEAPAREQSRHVVRGS